MAWRRPGDKPLSEPMMVSLPMHICVTQPQWVMDSTNTKIIIVTAIALAMLFERKLATHTIEIHNLATSFSRNWNFNCMRRKLPDYVLNFNCVRRKLPDHAFNFNCMRRKLPDYVFNFDCVRRKLPDYVFNFNCVRRKLPDFIFNFNCLRRKLPDYVFNFNCVGRKLPDYVFQLYE